MYLCAMEGEKDASKAREYRDYLFSLQSGSKGMPCSSGRKS
jgi:hypothetical protein